VLFVIGTEPVTVAAPVKGNTAFRGGITGVKKRKKKGKVFP